MSSEARATGSRTWDVVIAGAGFAGSLLARILATQGWRVLLVEKGRHPRFALGESSTPLANFALERLARRWKLPDLHALAAYGRWRRDLPELRRGLKRGFTFFQHRSGVPLERSCDFAAGDGRLLVAASPEDALADSHWLRADVDHFLLERAIEAGAGYRGGVELTSVVVDEGGVTVGGGDFEARADFLVDATGPGGLAGRLGIEAVDAPVAEMAEDDAGRPSTLLLYGHFEGVRDTVDVLLEAGVEVPRGPYLDDRAAVHHLLDEGWMYVLPFDEGAAGQRLTSAGVVLRRGTDPELCALALEAPRAAWTRLLARYPTLQSVFATATEHRPLAVLPRLRHRLSASTDAAFGRWLLLPHAYAFFDPLYSTGLAWSLLGVERVVDLFQRAPREAAGMPSRVGLARYAELLSVEADHVDRLIAGAYLAMGDFQLLAAQTQLYFAAASFQELRQRLVLPAGDSAAAWEGFLGATDSISRDFVAEGETRLRQQRSDFADWVASAIEPRNVVGLADPGRRNLYPVDLDVLLRDGHRLGLDRAQLHAALPLLRGGQL